MKKTWILLALPLAMVACGKKGPEADADKMCDMMKKYSEAKKAGNNEEADKIEKEGRAFGNELEEKYKDDKDGMKTIKDRTEKCEEEYIH